MKTFPEILSVAELKKLAHKNFYENILFQQSVKNIDSSEFDTVTHTIALEYTNSIDCNKCGNCCNTQQVGIAKKEIAIINK